MNDQSINPAFFSLKKEHDHEISIIYINHQLKDKGLLITHILSLHT
jgi:hypothetical protein